MKNEIKMSYTGYGDNACMVTILVINHSQSSLLDKVISCDLTEWVCLKVVGAYFYNELRGIVTRES